MIKQDMKVCDQKILSITHGHVYNWGCPCPIWDPLDMYRKFWLNWLLIAGLANKCESNARSLEDNNCEHLAADKDGTHESP